MRDTAVVTRRGAGHVCMRSAGTGIRAASESVATRARAGARIRSDWRMKPPESAAVVHRRHEHAHRGRKSCGPRTTSVLNATREVRRRTLTADASAVTLQAPGHGRHPVSRRDHVPRLGAPRGGRVRHRHVRRLGHGRDATRPRRRRHVRLMVRRRQGRRGRRRVQVHDPHARRRPLAHRPLRAPGHDVGRERGRVRQRRIRLGRRRLPDAGLGRPRHLRAPRRDVRGHGRQARHVRRRRQAPRVSREARRVGRAGDAAVRVRRRHQLGLQPCPHVRDRELVRRPRRVQAVHPRCARARASPSSSTSSTTTSARRTSTCGGSTAGPRATAAGSTSTTTSARGRRGA